MHHNITGLLLALLINSVFFTLPTVAAELVCRDQPPEEVLTEVNKRVTHLRVANFNADLAMMATEYQELDSYLHSCATTDAEDLATNSRYVFACGVECHRQMASYQLFMARDFRLLSQKADQPTATPAAERLQHVDNGLAWIERGLAALPRQQTVKPGVFPDPKAPQDTKNTNNTNKSDDAASFNRYLADLAKLRITHLQLLMAGGDLWYQAVSQPRLQRLDFLVGQVLGQKTAVDTECAAKTDAKSKADCEAKAKAMDVSMQKAAGYYEQALWILIEAKTDIPPGDQNFSGAQSQFMTLEQDLRRRRESIQQGLLYIGIDPERYTRLSFATLAGELEKVGTTIAHLEDKVAVYVREWQTKKSAAASQGEKDQQVNNAMAMQVSGHKIGKLQSQLDADTILQKQQQSQVAQARLDLDKQYQQTKLKADQAQLALTLENATVNHASRLRNIEAELQFQLAEKQNEQKLIASRGKQDLLALDIQAQEEQRRELRWLIDFDIARTNLQVQIEALDAQITEYKRQTKDNDTLLSRLAEQQGQLDAEIQQLNEQIKQAEAQIADFKLQSADLFNLRQTSSQTQICGIQATLTILGRNLQADPACGISAPKYTIAATRTQLNALKTKYASDQTQAAAFILNCVIGQEEPLLPLIPVDLTKLPPVTCPNPEDTQLKLAQRIWDTEKTLVQSQLDRYEQARQKLLGHIQKFRGYIRQFKKTKDRLEEIVNVAENAYQALAASPVAGFTIDLGAPVQRLYELAKSKLELGLKAVDDEMQQALKDGQLDEKLVAAENLLKQLQEQRQKGELAFQRTLAQLNVDAQTQANKIMNSVYGQGIGALQTTLDDSHFEMQVQELTTKQQTLRADLALASRDNQRFAFRIADQESRIRQLQAQIRQVESRHRELELEKQSKQRDNQQLVELQQSVQKRKGLTSDLVVRVDGKAQASTNVTGVLGQMRDQFKQGAMALNQEEQAALDKAMQRDRQAAQAETTRQATEFAQTQQRIKAELAQLKQEDVYQRTQLELELKEQNITVAHLKFQQQTQLVISQEQDALLQQSQAELQRRLNQPGAMELVMGNEAELSQLLDGIPEFLASKGALLDGANTLLHLLRGKAAVIDSLSSRDLTPIYALDVGNDLPYALTYSQLNNARTQLERGVALNDSLVNTTGVAFTIPATSGLFQALASGEAIRFELRPGGARNEDAGYFNLWDEKLDNTENARLLDVFIGLTYAATAPKGCKNRQQYTLRHQGNGFVFLSSSQGSTALTPAFSMQSSRSMPKRNAFDLDNPRVRARFEDRRDNWDFPVQGELTVRHFIEAGEGKNATLSFMGLPLSSIYELEFHQNTACPLTAATEIEMAFVYSSR